jgi:small GTP-binding protein
MWDTSGQERFRAITPSYYRGSHGFLVVYDVTNRESFHNLQNWMEEIERSLTKEGTPMILIGNKIDAASGYRRQVSREDGQAFAQEHKMSFLETSAKNAENVDTAFHELFNSVVDKCSSGIETSAKIVLKPASSYYSYCSGVSSC